ncbi:hypothetical protein Pst134EB_028441 [Puccinia striiformis f. sp. tritici]|nr:hypothetical protein Pst134EB_028441 [Puccinia striiformis f. sp. tritici]
MRLNLGQSELLLLLYCVGTLHSKLKVSATKKIKEHQHMRNQSPQSQEKAEAIFSQPEPNSQEVHGQTHTDSDLLILVESINLYYDIVLKLTNCTIRISALSPRFSVHQVIQTQPL